MWVAGTEAVAGWWPKLERSRASLPRALLQLLQKFYGLFLGDHVDATHLRDRIDKVCGGGWG